MSFFKLIVLCVLLGVPTTYSYGAENNDQPPHKRNRLEQEGASQDQTSSDDSDEEGADSTSHSGGAAMASEADLGGSAHAARAHSAENDTTQTRAKRRSQKRKHTLRRRVSTRSMTSARRARRAGRGTAQAAAASSSQAAAASSSQVVAAAVAAAARGVVPAAATVSSSQAAAAAAAASLTAREVQLRDAQDAQRRAQLITASFHESALMSRQVAEAFLTRWEAHIARRQQNPRGEVRFDVLTAVQELPALRSIIRTIKYAINRLTESDPAIRQQRVQALRQQAIAASRGFIARLGVLFPNRVRIIRTQLMALRAASAGASDSMINSLPSHKLVSDLLDSDGSVRDCVICLEPMQAQETMRALPCGHVLHKLCIDRWLGVNAVCPICKKKVFANQQRQQQR